MGWVIKNLDHFSDEVGLLALSFSFFETPILIFT